MALDDLPNTMDKTASKAASPSDPSDEKAFWLPKTPAERLGALEFMRQVADGYDPATTRLQIVLEVLGVEQTE